MTKRPAILTLATLASVLGIVVFVRDAGGQVQATGWKLVGWNDLGMHCMDGTDYSVSSVLPPFNTFHAHLIDPNGKLVKSASGVTITYQAVADPTGSLNTTSINKTNFWQYVQSMFGAALAPDVGLKGYAMPGSKNVPQKMTFDPAYNWFTAEGVPITPYDNAGNKNYLPLMRLVARNTSGTVLATSDIVLPVSDEMDCKVCHASGSNLNAMPKSGWAWNSNPAKDVKFNVLRLHDQYQPPSQIASLLSQAKFSASGLEATAKGGKPVLCETCHPSNALPGLGLSGVSRLTRAMHHRHSAVVDPTNGLSMDQNTNRSACYRCHPGAVTKCLRGVMGNAVASDGTMEIQCQNCHGSMSTVANVNRLGWLDEPNCQACHAGTAISNNGQIRYTSVFDTTGAMRTAVNQTFATNANSPAAGLSLYRFSKGHGGLECEACHGSTHAEFPSSHVNDNLQSTKIQGHTGTLAECQACHGTVPSSPNGGPHGLHPVGQSWVSAHHEVIQQVGLASCQGCHGADYRGTVLSRSKADRTITTEMGTKTFWRGFQIGCYTCHRGPNSDDANPNHAAVVANASASTATGVAVRVGLRATDADGNALTLRVVSQPAHGTAGLSGTIATYYPEPGFAGTDTFTFAAWDGSTDSNLGTVTVSVR